MPAFWPTAVAVACPLMLFVATFGCLLFAFSGRFNATLGNGLRTTALVAGILYLIFSVMVGLLTAFAVVIGSGSGGPL